MPEPFIQDSDFTLYVGDVRDVLAGLPAESVDCVVTSPPYWGLRDYSVEGQLGLEPTPEEYVANMVEVFRGVRRVLSPHGTCWVNLGDSYSGGGGYAPDAPINKARANGEGWGKFNPASQAAMSSRKGTGKVAGLKPKDLVGIPWRIAFALQADGWYLRADIIWSKPNPMPESVTDRPTKAHEYVFLLSKQPRYFFDQEAVRESAEHGRREWKGNVYAGVGTQGQRTHVNVGGGVVTGKTATGNSLRVGDDPSAGRNIRSVWEIATQPYPEAHFATYPEALVERCLKAGCPEQVCRTCGKPRERIVETEILEDVPLRWTVDPASIGLPAGRRNPADAIKQAQGKRRHSLGFTDCGHDDYRPGVVLDPFLGSGTSALVARRLGRHCVGIELNQSYAEMAAKRLSQLSLLA